jgi:septum formation protein
MRTVPTTVHFARLSSEEIDAYCATGEPAQVAGGFTIDGLGGWFVERIEGDHHNVVGLSLPTLREMLIELGYTLADIGYPHRP